MKVKVIILIILILNINIYSKESKSKLILSYSPRILFISNLMNDSDFEYRVDKEEFEMFKKNGCLYKSTDIAELSGISLEIKNESKFSTIFYFNLYDVGKSLDSEDLTVEAYEIKERFYLGEESKGSFIGVGIGMYMVNQTFEILDTVEPYPKSHYLTLDKCFNDFLVEIGYQNNLITDNIYYDFGGLCYCKNNTFILTANIGYKLF